MNRTGRAAVFEGRGRRFALREYPLVKPRPGELLVRVRMSTICRSNLDARPAKLRQLLTWGARALRKASMTGEWTSLSVNRFEPESHAATKEGSCHERTCSDFFLHRDGRNYRNSKTRSHSALNGFWVSELHYLTDSKPSIPNRGLRGLTGLRPLFSQDQCLGRHVEGVCGFPSRPWV